MRPLRSAAAVLALAAACLALGPGSASAEDAPVPGTMSTAAVNTARFDIPVPKGVVPRAITGVLTMPEVVNNGVVTFRVNGRIARTMPSTLYAKVRIPVTAADVIADGTIGLTMASQGPPVGDLCRPAAGEASLRKIALVYRGQERAPTTLANFFPPSSNRIDVLIAAEADDDLLEAGVAAVAALSSRYREGTEIELGTLADAPTAPVASQRVVVLTAGRPGEVTTDISVTPGTGVPVLTITANGDDLAAAAKALAVTEGGDGLQLAGDPAAEGISGELGKREADLEQSLAEVGAAEVALSGYGVTAQVVKIPQDAFSSPVTGLQVHLQGANTAVADADRARLDVRMNGELVGSQSLDETGVLDMDFTVPAGKLRSVNELQLVLSAVTPDGLPCAAPGSPPIEVDLDTEGSTLTATAGTSDTGAFQLWPQVLQGSLPVAVRNERGQRFGAFQELARVVGALQRAASFPLDVQLVPANAFIADDRSGIIIGANAGDAASLDAPLKLSSIRLLDQADSSFEVTSQEPYAVLEAVGPTEDVDRQVLMLGGWAPGNQPAPQALTTKLVDYLVSGGWAALEGDLLLTDSSAPPFTVDSTTLALERPAGGQAEKRSYAKWFVAGVVLLLLVLAFQVLVSIRRDRRVAQAEVDEPVTAVSAYLEDLEFREQNLPPTRPVEDTAPHPSPEPSPQPSPQPRPQPSPQAPPATPPVTPPVTQAPGQSQPQRPPERQLRRRESDKQ